MNLNDISESHRETLLACEAVGLLHNAGKLAPDNTQMVTDFQKVSAWTYLEHIAGKKIPAGVKDLFFDTSGHHRIIRQEQIRELEFRLVKQLAVYLAPNNKLKIISYIDEYQKEYKDTPHNERKKPKVVFNTLMSYLIKDLGVPETLRSGFFLFRLSAVKGLDLSSFDIDRYVNAYLGKPLSAKTAFKIKKIDFSLSMLLNIFWDNFHLRTADSDNTSKRSDNLKFWLGLGGPDSSEISQLARLMAVCHEAISRGDKPDLKISSRSTTVLTTVFGKEITQSQTEVKSIAELFELSDKSDMSGIEQCYKNKAADGRLPVNDVSLYAYCCNFGAFFKTALAAVILKGHFPEPHEHKWRTLSFRINGIDWISRGTRLADLIARKETLNQVFNAVIELLEKKIPLFKCIYADIHGLCFLAPDVADILDCKVSNNKTLSEKITQTCLDISNHELSFDMVLSEPEFGYRINISKQMKVFSFPKPDMPAIKEIWEKMKNQKNFLEVCTTCGLKPVDRDHRVAESLNLCRDCFIRKTGRTKEWLGNRHQTIWTSEISDQKNRCALVTFRFDLSEWIDSKAFTQTMPDKCRISKDGDTYTSFTRIRDVWRQTELFFDELNKKLPSDAGLSKKTRWVMMIEAQQIPNDLNPFHAYEIGIGELSFQAVFTAQSSFICVDSRLDAYQADDWKELFKKEANIEIRDRQGPGGKKKNIMTLLTTDCTVPVKDEGNSFYPYINIIKDPVRFAALVPAIHAFDIVCIIQEEYKRAFVRVSDCLPCQAGIVFFKSRTPVSSVLDTGRRILSAPFKTLEYDSSQIKISQNSEKIRLSFSGGEQLIFPSTICGYTDIWYMGHLFENPVENPVEKSVENYRLKNKLTLKPSLLELFYLSENGKRHRLFHDENGDRHDPDFGPMPLNLSQLPEFSELWQILGQVPRHQLSKIEASGHYLKNELGISPTHKQGVRFLLNTVKQIENGFWKKLNDVQKQRLKCGIESGLVLIVLRIWLHVFAIKPRRGD